MKKYKFLLFLTALLFSCSKVSEKNTTEENIINIAPENVMKYDFRKAIEVYDIPKLAFKYDNIEEGDTIAGFPKSISKFIPIGKKEKVLDATWISKVNDKEIQVWYTQDKKGLWIPFNAEERKISKFFLENQ